MDFLEDHTLVEKMLSYAPMLNGMKTTHAYTKEKLEKKNKRERGEKGIFKAEGLTRSNCGLSEVVSSKSSAIEKLIEKKNAEGEKQKKSM